MIKINKDLNNTPQSLIPAFTDLFLPLNIPRKVRTTHLRRMSVIDSGVYIDDQNHNSRYKQNDIKNKLTEIYHNKCAFCEQYVEQIHVEHYRPKSIYYWLAYSWDNLIYACGTCNQTKAVNFDVINARTAFINNEVNLRNINVSSVNYDATEQPLMVNPEVTDPLHFVRFKKSGLIESDNVRFAYTIEKCSIDRKAINDDRRKILDIFRRDMESIMVKHSKDEQRLAITTIVEKFIRDSQDKELQFLAFRRYSIAHDWLNEIIKELN